MAKTKQHIMHPHNQSRVLCGASRAVSAVDYEYARQYDSSLGCDTSRGGWCAACVRKLRETHYVLWGRPNTTTDGLKEKVLLSEATADECDRGELIAAKDGWHMFRRVAMDNSVPDFAKTLNI